LNILEAVKERGAAFKPLREPWADTTTPAGRLAVTILAGFAEFDREQILERTAEGRAHAQARGVKMGRRPTLTARQVAFIRQERASPAKQSLGELAALLGVSRSTICRAAREKPDLNGSGPAPKGTGPRQIDIEEVAGPGGGVTPEPSVPA
jgi:DNA invertase Pin-like site-specific DNA recombinase